MGDRTDEIREAPREDDRFDLPERTGGCRVCGWETWDGDCNECEKRAVGRTESELTSNDAEPPVGSVVRDAFGRLWRRFDEDRRSWMPVEDDGGIVDDDPESWVRVAGNFGPVVFAAYRREVQ